MDCLDFQKHFKKKISKNISKKTFQKKHFKKTFHKKHFRKNSKKKVQKTFQKHKQNISQKNISKLQRFLRTAYLPEHFFRRRESRTRGSPPRTDNFVEPWICENPENYGFFSMPFFCFSWPKLPRAPFLQNGKKCLDFLTKL